ncbi:vancomycin resistance protein YoaR [Georgenia soli]|uniref:Vancomycin resistance protein YoaR n=1 Tax=Georgenia soli TaxID=638953 RepID=A0A2A9EIW1_9MICO|nr:VanW family protein [Georgenia soli]PFG38753.1 vancomycin resistance protein YoaR [Georgenia soli]
MTDHRAPGRGAVDHTDGADATPQEDTPSGMSDLNSVLARRQGEPDATAVHPARAGSAPEPDATAVHPARAGSAPDPDATAVHPARAGSAPDPDATAVHPAPSAAAPQTSEPKDPPMPSPLDQFDVEEPRRGRRGLVIGLVVVALLVVAYGLGAWFLGDRTPTGTTVAGVPVGGLSKADARARLESELSTLAAEQVPVSVGEATSSIDPASVKLTFDADATLEDLTGFTLDPRVLWGRIFGLGAVEPRSTVDEDALRDALETAATELDVAPVEGAITFAGATPEVTEPAPGTAVDIDAAVDAVTRTWLTAERPLELPTKELSPTVGAEAVDEALTTLAQPLVSAPLTVNVDGALAELSPEQLAANATFVAQGDALELELDGEGLADAVAEVNPAIEVAGKDAQIVLQGGRPTIIPSTTGKGLDPDQLAEAVRTAGTSTDRTAEVALVVAEPEFTTADAEALGVKEVIADFSTPMPYDPVRTTNLKVGAQKVTGVLVMPGEEFSLLDTIGPISAANGYVSSGVVEDGFVSTAVGGGLSQLSTNMFNVGFLAGMDDVTHTPHSRWFERYPPGREATLWEPSTDMVWRNNTDYGVLVQSWVTGDRVHSRLWGTKVWDVKTSTSEKYNIVQPKTVYNPSPECTPESGGNPGFTVTVDRQRYKDGALHDDEKWTWTYTPWNKVECGEPPSDEG